MTTIVTYAIWEDRELVADDLSRDEAIVQLTGLLARASTANVEALLDRVDESYLALEYAGLVIQGTYPEEE